jgi:hypothetical protein
MGKTKYLIDLSDNERNQLSTIINENSAGTSTITRAKVLFLSDIHHVPKLSIPVISNEVGVSRQTIVKIRNNYCQDGFDSALHEKVRDIKSAYKKARCNNKDLIDNIKVLIQAPPSNAKRWTVRSLCEECLVRGYVKSISPATMMRLLKKNNIVIL